GQAWIDLLMCAAYTDTEVFIRQSLIKLKRGQQARAESGLAKNWGWSRDKTRRFLKLLVEKGMIIQQKNRRISIVTICKYDAYQIIKTSSDTTGNTTGKQNDQNEALYQKQQTAHSNETVSNCNRYSYKSNENHTIQQTIQQTNIPKTKKADLNDKSTQKTAPLSEVTNNFKITGYKTGNATSNTTDQHRSNIGQYNRQYSILNNINNINKINNNNNPQAGVRDGMLVSPNLIDEIYRTHPKPIAPNFTKRAVLKALNKTLEDGINPEDEAKRILEATK
ncbi:MAG: hypothetical protein GY743_19395, partial [Planctomycetaceae bacterium]|nr:hypothetical protein [Planctomycetaceae bacterium]